MNTNNSSLNTSIFNPSSNKLIENKSFTIQDNNLYKNPHNLFQT